MKLFGIGNYDCYGGYGPFGIVMAENEKEAIHKMAQKVIEYEKEVNNWTDEDIPDTEEEIVKEYCYIADKQLSIRVIEDDTYLGENC